MRKQITEERQRSPCARPAENLYPEQVKNTPTSQGQPVSEKQASDPNGQFTKELFKDPKAPENGDMAVSSLFKVHP